MKPGYVRRFSPVERLLHWVNAAGFFFLLVTVFFCLGIVAFSLPLLRLFQLSSSLVIKLNSMPTLA